MKQAVDMMGQMGPEQMASMMGSMSPGMPGGQPDPSAMAGLLADPKSRELVRQMMSNIDPQQLAAMSKASGQALTPEQVRHMLLIAPGVVMRPGLRLLTRMLEAIAQSKRHNTGSLSISYDKYLPAMHCRQRL